MKIVFSCYIYQDLIILPLKSVVHQHFRNHTHVLSPHDSCHHWHVFLIGQNKSRPHQLLGRNEDMPSTLKSAVFYVFFTCFSSDSKDILHYTWGVSHSMWGNELLGGKAHLLPSLESQFSASTVGFLCATSEKTKSRQGVIHGENPVYMFKTHTPTLISICSSISLFLIVVYSFSSLNKKWLQNVHRLARNLVYHHYYY